MCQHHEKQQGWSLNARWRSAFESIQIWIHCFNVESALQTQPVVHRSCTNQTSSAYLDKNKVPWHHSTEDAQIRSLKTMHLDKQMKSHGTAANHQVTEYLVLIFSYTRWNSELMIWNNVADKRRELFNYWCYQTFPILYSLGVVAIHICFMCYRLAFHASPSKKNPQVKKCGQPRSGQKEQL